MKTELLLSVVLLTVLAALLLATGLGAVTIYEIQYTANPGAGTYPSPLFNHAVTTQGIVTASGYSGGSGYFISMLMAVSLFGIYAKAR